MLEKFDNYLVFALTIAIIVTAIQKLAAAGFKKLGWTGPAGFFS